MGAHKEDTAKASEAQRQAFEMYRSAANETALAHVAALEALKVETAKGAESQQQALDTFKSETATALKTHQADAAKIAQDHRAEVAALKMELEQALGMQRAAAIEAHEA